MRSRNSAVLHLAALLAGSGCGKGNFGPDQPLTHAQTELAELT